MRKKRIENGLKPLNDLLKNQYRLQVKMIITLVGVSENTWNAWVRNVRVPQEEKKELFVKVFDQAAENPYNFGGRTKGEIISDIKNLYREESGLRADAMGKNIDSILELDELLYFIMEGVTTPASTGEK